MTGYLPPPTLAEALSPREERVAARLDRDRRRARDFTVEERLARLEVRVWQHEHALRILSDVPPI